jgi:hypothetical protein
MSFSKRNIAEAPDLSEIQGISAVSRIGCVNRAALGSGASRYATVVESSVALRALAPRVAKLSFLAS